MLSIYRYLKNHRRMFFLILASLLLVGILPVLSFAAFTYRYFREYVGSQVVSAQLDRLRQTESYINAVLDEVEAKSYEFVLNVRFMELGTIGSETIGHVDMILAARRAQELLQNLRDTNDFIQSVYYYNRSRDFFITPDGSLARQLYYDTDWITGGLPKQEAAPLWLATRQNLDYAIRSTPDLTRMYEALGIQSTPVLSFVRPVSRYIAEFGGFVVINLNVPGLADHLAVVTREPEGEFLILNGAGQVLLSTNRSSIGENLGPSFLNYTGDSREGTTIVNRNDRARIWYYLVGKNDWVYVFSRDDSALNALYREIGGVTALLTLALVGIAAAVALVFSDKLYHPIDAIISDIGGMAGKLPGGKNELVFIHDMLGRALRESSELRAFADRSSQAIKENTLRRLVSGQVSEPGRVLEGLRVSGRKLTYPCCGMALVVMDTDLRIDSSRLQVVQMALIQYCESVRRTGIEILGVSTGMRRIALLINTLDITIARQTLRHIHDEASVALDLSVRIIAGRFGNGIMQAAASYDDAVAVLDSRVLEEGVGVVFSDDIEVTRSNASTYPFEIEERLIYHLKTGSIQEVRNQLDRFLKHIFSSREVDRRQVETACIALISAIVRTISLSGGNPASDTGVENPYRDFLEQDTTVNSIRAWFLRFFDTTLDNVFVRGDRHGKYKRLIERCIETHYGEDISLELIASLTGISYSYIRKIFSTIFGRHFNDYLNAFRIEKARGYLCYTDETISEIARRVGYPNEQRFYRNFKKLIGCTPKEYRIAAGSIHRDTRSHHT